MISTFSTFSTFSTSSTSVASNVSSYVSSLSGSGTLSGIAVAALLLFLIVRELSGAKASSERGTARLRFFYRSLVVPVVPLLVVFVVIVAVRVWQTLFD